MLDSQGSHHGNVTSLQSPCCPRCGSAVKAGKKFCSQCGSPVGAQPATSPAKRVRRASICLECGFENHHSDQFCKSCGTLLAVPPASFASSNGSPDAAKLAASTPIAIVPATMPEGADAQVRRDSPEAKAVAFGTKALEVPTAQSEAPSVSTATVELPPSQANFQTVKPGFFRARELGLGAVGVTAVGVLVLAAIVLFSTRHYGRGASKQVSNLSGTLMAQQSPAASASPVSPALSAPDQRPRSVEKLPRVSHAKANSGKAQRSSDESASAPEAALGSTAPVPQAALPSLPVRTNPATAVLGLAQAPIPALASDAPQTPKAQQKISAAVSPPARSVAIAANLSPAIPSLGEALPEAPPKPSTGAQNFRVGGVVQPARALVHPLPEYPMLARSRHLGGSVRLTATVRKDGSVTNVKVATGDLLLADAAREAVQRWRYQPAKLDGQSIDSQVDIEINFHLPE